jgi:hypothetical protein
VPRPSARRVAVARRDDEPRDRAPLHRIGDILEIQGENPFKVRAYRRPPRRSTR